MSSTVYPIANGLPMTLSTSKNGKYVAYSIQGNNVTTSGPSNWYYGGTNYSLDFGVTFLSAPQPSFPTTTTNTSVITISLSVFTNYILQSFNWTNTATNLPNSAIYLFDMLAPTDWYQLPSTQNEQVDACGNQISLLSTGNYITSIINNENTLNNDGTPANLFLFLVTNITTTSSSPKSQYIYQYNPLNLLLCPSDSLYTSTSPIYVNTKGLDVCLSTMNINQNYICSVFYSTSSTTFLVGSISVTSAASGKNSWIQLTPGVSLNKNFPPTFTVSTVALTNYNNLSSKLDDYFLIINNKFSTTPNQTPAVYYYTVDDSDGLLNKSYTQLTFNSTTDGSPNALVYVDSNNTLFLPISNYNKSTPSCGFISIPNFTPSNSSKYGEYNIDNNFNYWTNINVTDFSNNQTGSNELILYLISSTSEIANSGSLYEIPLNLPASDEKILGGSFYIPTIDDKSTYKYILSSKTLPSITGITPFKYLNFMMLGAGGQGQYGYNASTSTSLKGGSGGSGLWAINIPYNYTSKGGTQFYVTSLTISPGKANTTYTTSGSTGITSSFVNIIYNNDPSNNLTLTCASGRNGGVAPVSGNTKVVIGVDFSNNYQYTSPTTDLSYVVIDGPPGVSGQPARLVSTNTLPITTGTTTTSYNFQSGTRAGGVNSTYVGNVANIKYTLPTNCQIRLPSFGGTVFGTLLPDSSGNPTTFLPGTNFPTLNGYGGGGAAVLSGQFPEGSTSTCNGTDGCIVMYYSY